MRWMSVLMLAGGIVTALETGLPGGANLWANDECTRTAEALIATQNALTNAQTALTQTETALRTAQADLTKTQTALAKTEAALSKTEKAAELATKEANQVRSELSSAQTKLIELSATSEALARVIIEKGELQAKLLVSDGKLKKAEAALSAAFEEIKKYAMPGASVEPASVPKVEAILPPPPAVVADQASSRKSIIFHNRAGFLCGQGGMPVSPGGRPPVLVYPDMTIEFDSNGAYSVTFAVETPRTDVTLNLELTVPFVAPVGHLRPCNEWRMVEEVPAPTAGGPPMALYEARVTVPPIHLVADRSDQKSGTVQYHARKTWATGTSAGLALAYGCHSGSETLHIPSSPYPLLAVVGMPVASRSGTASVGTIVK